MRIIKKLFKKIPLFFQLYVKMRYWYYAFNYCFCNRKKLVIKHYKKAMKKKIDLNNVTTFNEKLQWLKLYWHNDLAIKCADKYLVREVVKERYGDHILNTLYGVYDDANEIDFDKLPDKFVLKVNHGCGYNIFCKDKSQLNVSKVRKELNKMLKQKYYVYNYEWIYEGIKPKIICEELLEYKENGFPADYKFFCCNGEPKFMFIATDRYIDTRFDFYDLDFNKIPVKQHYENSQKVIEKPANFEKMIEISKCLAKDFPFVRIDLYNINGKIIFGEYTFFHFTGQEKFEPEEYDKIFGEMIDINIK